MIPIDKVKKIIDRFISLEKELSTGKVEPKLLAKKKGMKNVKEAGTPTKILLENVIVFSISLCSR